MAVQNAREVKGWIAYADLGPMDGVRVIGFSTRSRAEAKDQGGRAYTQAKDQSLAGTRWYVARATIACTEIESAG